MLLQIIHNINVELDQSLTVTKLQIDITLHKQNFDKKIELH